MWKTDFWTLKQKHIRLTIMCLDACPFSFNTFHFCLLFSYQFIVSPSCRAPTSGSNHKNSPLTSCWSISEVKNFPLRRKESSTFVLKLFFKTNGPGHSNTLQQNSEQNVHIMNNFRGTCCWTQNICVTVRAATGELCWLTAVLCESDSC